MYTQAGLVFFILLQQQSDVSCENLEENSTAETCHLKPKILIWCQSRLQIHVEEVEVGRSLCSDCCPKPTDCKRQASNTHKSYVTRACNGRQTCSIDTVRQNTRCGQSDFERITFRCDDPTKTTDTTMSSLPSTSSAENMKTNRMAFDSVDSTVNAETDGATDSGRLILLICCIVGAPLVLAAVIAGLTKKGHGCQFPDTSKSQPNLYESVRPRIDIRTEESLYTELTQLAAVHGILDRLPVNRSTHQERPSNVAT